MVSRVKRGLLRRGIERRILRQGAEKQQESPMFTGIGRLSGNRLTNRTALSSPER